MRVPTARWHRSRTAWNRWYPERENLQVRKYPSEFYAIIKRSSRSCTLKVADSSKRRSHFTGENDGKAIFYSLPMNGWFHEISMQSFEVQICRQSRESSAYTRMNLIFVILISGLHCSGFVQASDFDSYERMILLSVIFMSRLHCICEACEPWSGLEQNPGRYFSYEFGRPNKMRFSELQK